jgi:hypothetical protein
MVCCQFILNFFCLIIDKRDGCYPTTPTDKSPRLTGFLAADYKIEETLTFIDYKPVDMLGCSRSRFDDMNDLTQIV